MSVRAVLAATALLPLLAACSGDDAAATSSTVISTSASSETTTPTSESSTSSSTSSTSTSSTSSTSTIPAVEGLDMSPDGLGDAMFGAEAESVITYVRAILGAPTSDSGWVDPFAILAACPGTEVRFVEWDDLALTFSDESFYGSGIRHFASFRYGPTMRSYISPYGLTTLKGLGIGATVTQLRSAYPNAVVYPGNEVAEPSIEIADSLVAFLTDTSANGHAVSYMGGYGCGE